MMQTWSKNSKKCLKVRFFLGIFLLTSAPTTAAASVPPIQTQLISEIETHLKSGNSGSFAHLLSNWQTRHQTKAVVPLLKIATNPNVRDATRYIAIMGAAKLGGEKTAPEVVGFLNHSSWMLRTAAIRALNAIGGPAQGRKLLPMLNDSALVVRTEAALAIANLQPEGALESLLSTLKNPANYHGGKAQWVPQKALEGIRQLHANRRFNSQKKPEILQTLDHVAKLYRSDKKFLKQVQELRAVL